MLAFSGSARRMRRRGGPSGGGGPAGAGWSAEGAHAETIAHTLEQTGVQSMMGSSPSIADLYQLASENVLLRNMLRPGKGEEGAKSALSTVEEIEENPPPLFATALPLLRQGCMAMVDDSFTRCFKSAKSVPWNWNVYLFPAWCMGVVLRYTVLFPLRLFALVLGFVVFAMTFPVVKMLGRFMDMSSWEKSLIQLLASAFVASWSGVIRFHGLRPTPRPGQPAGIFVANHSSMIDFIILLQSHPYAVIGQKHPGWVGYLQDTVLTALNCIWFDRGESNDRRVVADRLNRHAHDPSKADCPMLVFPEGTCVNNEFVVQFKKGVFELGVPINPIAIKYNKVFVDGYWNSRQQSFAQHLIRLMTSWAVVCDIWFLDQQTIRPGEDSAEFARRVQRLIAARAGLKAVDWDGYMKYWKPSERLVEKGKTAVAQELLSALELEESPEGPVSINPRTAHVLPPGAGAVPQTSAAVPPPAASKPPAAPAVDVPVHAFRPASSPSDAAISSHGNGITSGVGARVPAASPPAVPAVPPASGAASTTIMLGSAATPMMRAVTMPVALGASPMLSALPPPQSAPSLKAADSTFEIGDDDDAGDTSGTGPTGTGAAR